MTKTTVVLQKSDFTDYALSLGIWETLSGGSSNVEEVEVEIVRQD